MGAMAIFNAEILSFKHISFGRYESRARDNDSLKSLDLRVAVSSISFHVPRSLESVKCFSHITHSHSRTWLQLDRSDFND